MDVKIVEKEALIVIEMRAVTIQKNNTIPQFWDKFIKHCQKIENISRKNVSLGLYSIP